MAKSKALPSTTPTEDLSDKKEAWFALVDTFFKASHSTVASRYRWIARIRNAAETKDYVLEDQGEFLLTSCRYSPDLYIRAGVKDLKDRREACAIYQLILDARWTHPKLKQVLMRVGTRAVPIEALARNESHRHTFLYQDALDHLTLAQAEARWYLDKEDRRQALLLKGLPEAYRAKVVTDALDILCRGDLLWSTQDGDLFRGYLLNPTVGNLVLVKYDPDTSTLVQKDIVRPPKLLNPVSVAMYKTHLHEQDAPPQSREWALSAMCEYYETHMNYHAQIKTPH